MSGKNVTSIHHVQFYVSNALQASFWYCFNFGFKRFAIKRTREDSEVAIRNGNIVLTFKCSISPDHQEIGLECSKHGDFVKNVSFVVDDLEGMLLRLAEHGCEILEGSTLIGDDNGSLRVARIKGSAGSITHTLIQNLDYRGDFMPGFRPLKDFNLDLNMTPLPFYSIDHVVEAHEEGTIDSVTEWYNKTLKMQRFWSIDDRSVHTEFSALKAVLTGNDEKSVKITLVEPVTLKTGIKRRGQVQDFLDHHGGQGIQHIAFSTDDILKTIEIMRGRAIEFLDIPESYYDMLETRLEDSLIKPSEDLKKIRELKILMDFDENGYLLQIFTKPMQDRPALFLEIIQRHNYDGFGAGNFKALFSAVEMEQTKRELELDAAPTESTNS